MAHMKEGLVPHRWLLAAALALLSFAVSAAGPGAVRKQIESSMRVTGTIDVSPDGSVRTYSIDEAEKIPKGVLGFIQQNIDEWKFDPVLMEGKPVGVRNKMSLRVVAKKLGGDEYSIRLQAASFDPLEVETDHEVSSISMSPPKFPVQAARSGVTGTAYLVVKVARDGKVEDVVAEQVNLRIVASENQMGKWRSMLASASIQAAREWNFKAPTAGAQANEEYWVVRVPVDFKFWPDHTSYGQWEAYVPGPRQHHPWSEGGVGSGSPEALAAGGVYLIGSGGLRLLTPLGEQG